MAIRFSDLITKDLTISAFTIDLIVNLNNESAVSIVDGKEKNLADTALE